MSTLIQEVSNFNKYVDLTEKLAQGTWALGHGEYRQRVRMCLDGEPGMVLRREVGIQQLRQNGAFFTGTNLANRIAHALKVGNHYDNVYFDPTCGAGDLLLAIARYLPTAETVHETLDCWNELLSGCDIVPEFVRLTKARLVLLAAKRCNVRLNEEKIRVCDTFSQIVVKDFLSHSELTHSADVVVMNPPYGYIPAPTLCKWARGRICAAALFTERVIEYSRSGVRIIAVLPEVLRSGSRYSCWRKAIRSWGNVRFERSVGLFDQWADVDVYLLDFVRTNAKTYDNSRSDSIKTGGIGRRFKVHVGTVVPHRHPEVGLESPYVHARSLTAWREYSEITERRKFSGRLFKPPFVVVRRTSRPGGGKRALATLVLGQEAVAVENHLIVMLPKDGEIETCRALIKRLSSVKTDNWINKKLRCRHLTVPVLAGMPWWYAI